MFYYFDFSRLMSTFVSYNSTLTNCRIEMDDKRDPQEKKVFTYNFVSFSNETEIWFFFFFCIFLMSCFTGFCYIFVFCLVCLCRTIFATPKKKNILLFFRFNLILKFRFCVYSFLVQFFYNSNNALCVLFCFFFLH